MPEAKDPWFEERHYRRNAINGSRKLLIAIMRSQGISLWQKPKYQRVQVSTAGLFERSARVSKFEAPAAEFYRLHPDSLHNVGRRRWYARPRQVVMYLAHAFGNASLPEIGRHFGKDHTTVLHACRAVKASEQLMFEASEILETVVKADAEETMRRWRAGMSSEEAKIEASSNGGFVYFIHAPATNAVKIGYSGDHPQKRLSTMQSGNADDLTLLGWIHGTLADERSWHERFADYRIRGEWFHLEGDVADFVRTISEAERLAA